MIRRNCDSSFLSCPFLTKNRTGGDHAYKIGNLLGIFAIVDEWKQKKQSYSAPQRTPFFSFVSSTKFACKLDSNAIEVSIFFTIFTFSFIPRDDVSSEIGNVTKLAQLVWILPCWKFQCVVPYRAEMWRIPFVQGTRHSITYKLSHCTNSLLN